MKNPAILAFLVFALAAQVDAQNSPPTAGGGLAVWTQNPNCGMIYDANYALSFCAPEGWVLDNSVLSKSGIRAAFYPAKSTWEVARGSGTVMYINILDKGPDETLASMMEAEVKNAKENRKSVVVKEGDSIKAGAETASVLLFAPAVSNRFEAIACFDLPKAVIIFVATSKNEEWLKGDYKAFLQLVKSYKFLGSNVTIEKK
jgi:hypothetical protein